jgi:hypothetical protein
VSRVILDGHLVSLPFDNNKACFNLSLQSNDSGDQSSPEPSLQQSLSFCTSVSSVCKCSSDSNPFWHVSPSTHVSPPS